MKILKFIKKLAFSHGPLRGGQLFESHHTGLSETGRDLKRNYEDTSSSNCHLGLAPRFTIKVICQIIVRLLSNGLGDLA